MIINEQLYSNFKGELMNRTYGYCRVSTKSQNIDRQIKNILDEFNNAKIYQEIYTGTTSERKEWKKLKKILKTGDTIVFDSVSRMSRNANEGIEEYFNLMGSGINLIFLKEHYIDTVVYQEQIKANNSLKTEDKDLNETILNGIREYLKRLATKQIKIAFDQAQKEVDDLRQRTKEGIFQAKIKGNIPGRKKGQKIETKKSKENKEKIIKLSSFFNGNLKDKEIIEIIKIDRGTFYKYKKELLNK